MSFDFNHLTAFLDLAQACYLKERNHSEANLFFFKFARLSLKSWGCYFRRFIISLCGHLKAGSFYTDINCVNIDLQQHLNQISLSFSNPIEVFGISPNYNYLYTKQTSSLENLKKMQTQKIDVLFWFRPHRTSVQIILYTKLSNVC